MSYKAAGRVPIPVWRRRPMMEADSNEEIDMATQNEGKGRDYDQVTKDGSSSAGTLGVGGTGSTDDVGKMSGERAAERDAGNRQQDVRTDDLLSNDAERDSGGYVGEEAGELQTGMGGIGSLSTGNAGSRQSADETRPGSDRGALNMGHAGGASEPDAGGLGPRK